MLLLFRLVVGLELPLSIIDCVPDEATFILRALDVLSDPLNLEVLLVQGRLGIHDITVDSVVVRVEVRILPLELL